jgi:hypothetical protein
VFVLSHLKDTFNVGERKKKRKSVLSPKHQPRVQQTFDVARETSHQSHRKVTEHGDVFFYNAFVSVNVIVRTSMSFFFVGFRAFFPLCFYILIFVFRRLLLLSKMKCIRGSIRHVSTSSAHFENMGTTRIKRENVVFYAYSM